MKRQTHTSGAFTLIELLIVVAIIALLVTILVPSLNTAREMTRRVVCATNMRSIGLAIVLYAQDNVDRLPYPGFNDTQIGGTYNISYDDLLGQCDGRNRAPTDPIGVVPEQHLYKCPSNDTPGQTRSYSMNDGRSSGTVPTGPGDDPGNNSFWGVCSPVSEGVGADWANLWSVRTADLEDASYTLVLVEWLNNSNNKLGGSARGACYGATALYQSLYWTEGLEPGKGWEPPHLEATSYLFADCHAETLAPRATLGAGTTIDTFLAQPYQTGSGAYRNAKLYGMWTRKAGD